MANYHIRRNGTPGICRAMVGRCPLGDSNQHYSTLEEAREIANSQNESLFGVHSDCELLTYERKKKDREKYSSLEANKRGEWIEDQLTIAIENGQTSLDLHFDKEYNLWSTERRKLHDKIIDKLVDKYKDVPTDGKVVFSGGITGAGKTTVLTEKLGLTSNDYATVSSDDFKELLAEEGAVPEVDGLLPMERTTLVHEESSQLADRFLSIMAAEKKNIIYDCTCKDFKSTKRRISNILNNGYNNLDIQLVFVDIPITVSHERAKNRYRNGLNAFSLGGRYCPPNVINAQAPSKGSNFNTQNSETVLAISKDKDLSIRKPIIFENSGQQPIEIKFEKFKQMKG